eukprot:3285783-Amphidinium_carterae.1
MHRQAFQRYTSALATEASRNKLWTLTCPPSGQTSIPLLVRPVIENGGVVLSRTLLCLRNFSVGG